MNRKIFFAFAVMMATGVSLMAAPPPPPGSNNAPIDAGLTVLAVAGAFIAGKKLLQKK